MKEVISTILFKKNYRFLPTVIFFWYYLLLFVYSFFAPVLRFPGSWGGGPYGTDPTVLGNFIFATTVLPLAPVDMVLGNKLGEKAGFWNDCFIICNPTPLGMLTGGTIAVLVVFLINLGIVRLFSIFRAH